MIKNITEMDVPAKVTTINDSFEMWAVTEQLSSHPFSVILIDDDFVSPHSEQIVRVVKQIQKKAAIVFITSDKSIELGQRISQLGIDFYGYKPLSREDLFEAINSLLISKSATLD